MSLLSSIRNLFGAQKTAQPPMKQRHLPAHILRDIKKAQQKNKAVQSLAPKGTLVVDAVFVNNNSTVGVQCDRGVFVSCDSDTLKSIMNNNGMVPAPAGTLCLDPTASLNQVACGESGGPVDAGNLRDTTNNIFLKQCGVSYPTIALGTITNITQSLTQICDAAQNAADAELNKNGKIAAIMGVSIGIGLAILAVVFYRCKRETAPHVQVQSTSRDALLTGTPRASGSNSIDSSAVAEHNTTYASVDLSY